MRYKAVFLPIFLILLIVLEARSNVINLPNKNINLIKRNDYEILLDNYLSSKETTVAIQGVGGIGKTQIAKSYAYSKNNNYDFIWWINCKSAFISQINEIIDSYSKNHKQETGIYKTGNIGIDMITAYNIINKYKKCLIIFDDYDFHLSEHINSFLDKVQKNNNIKILITTRDRFIKKKVSKTMNVKQYKREESLKYLKKLDIKKYKGEVKKLDELASLLNDHPLSIVCAYAYISTINGINVDDYIELYSSKYEGLRKLEQEIVENTGKKEVDDYSKTLNRVVEITLQEIKEKNKGAIKLIKAIALIHNQKISSETLLNFLDSDKIEYSRAINILLQYGLVEKKEEFYECHEEVHKAFYFYFDNKDLNSALTKIINLFNYELPNTVHLLNDYLGSRYYYLNHLSQIYNQSQKFGYTGNDIIKLKIRELEFILTGIRDKNKSNILIKEIENLMMSSKEVDDYNQIRFLLMKSTYTSWFDKNYNLAISQTQEVLSKIEKQNETLYAEELITALSKLAQIYSFIGKTERVFYYANIAEKIMKDNIVSNGYKQVLYGAKSLAYRHQGDYTNALKEINIAIELLSNKAKNFDKGFIGGIPIFINKLDIMLKLGLYKEVYNQVERLESKVKRIYGDEFNMLGTIYLTKAESIFRLGDIKKAKLCIDAVDINNTAKNITMLRIASAYKLKGDIYRANGEYTEAHKLFLEAEEMYKKYLFVFRVDNISDLYVSMVLNLLDNNEINKAFKYKRKHDDLFGDTHAGHYKMELYLSKKTMPDNFKSID